MKEFSLWAFCNSYVYPLMTALGLQQSVLSLQIIYSINCLVHKMPENSAHHNFPQPEEASSDFFICLTNVPKLETLILKKQYML